MRHGFEGPIRSRRIQVVFIAFLICSSGITTTEAGIQQGTTSQSHAFPDRVVADTADGYSAVGPLDGDRFSVAPQSMWLGTKKSGSVWQTTFAEPTQIGSFLQINSDDPHQLKNAPRNYSWQVSDDAEHWTILRETVVLLESRLFRIHRLKQAVITKHIRLVVNVSHGSAPALREVEFYPAIDAEIPFPDWIVAVSSDEDPDNVSLGMPFIWLARLCDGWERTPAQTIWHGDFEPDFAFAEPRPLCAFLSGSFLEWCQCRREPWRGVQEVLKSRRLPMWGACGGAQVLTILEETGVDQPWDCPRCRNPDQPLLPIYSHIGHTGNAPCGDYSKCIGERGRFQMKIERSDPAFTGLPEIFEIVESHIGQINHVPRGWHRLVTKGPGAHTVNQCLRTDDCPIYAAQFHTEMYQSTVDTSKQIMSNFLSVAKEWNDTQTFRGSAAGKTIVTVSSSTPDLPRKSEGDVIELNDGRLLLVSMEFGSDGSDFALCNATVKRLASGRLMLPANPPTPGKPAETGPYAATMLYCDDDGLTWQVSESRSSTSHGFTLKPLLQKQRTESKVSMSAKGGFDSPTNVR